MRPLSGDDRDSQALFFEGLITQPESGVSKRIAGSCNLALSIS